MLRGQAQVGRQITEYIFCVARVRLVTLPPGLCCSAGIALDSQYSCMAVKSSSISGDHHLRPSGSKALECREQLRLNSIFPRRWPTSRLSLNPPALPNTPHVHPPITASMSSSHPSQTRRIHDSSSVPDMPGYKADPNLARMLRTEVSNLLGRSQLGFPG
jgi:hypothetical protein